MLTLFLLICILQLLMLSSIGFTILNIFLAPGSALLLSLSLGIIAVIANILSKFKLNSYAYKFISAGISVLLSGIIIRHVNFAAFLIAVFYFLIFISVNINYNTGRDNVLVFVPIVLVFNIAIALIIPNIKANAALPYYQAVIFISTISTVILLIIKQINHSRTFGKNSMSISKTQKRNNIIFGVIMLVLLFALSSLGRISDIFKIIGFLFEKSMDLLSFLFSGPQQSGNYGVDPSVLEKLMRSNDSSSNSVQDYIFLILFGLIVIILVSLMVYTLLKTAVRLIKRLIYWFGNSERVIGQFSEEGHIDEKTNILNKNLDKMAKKLLGRIKGLFDKEVPYKKLPDDIARVRRIFQYFCNDAKLIGLSINRSRTADEICNKVSELSPDTLSYNTAMSKCYDDARYGNISPSPENLRLLERRYKL